MTLAAVNTGAATEESRVTAMVALIDALEPLLDQETLLVRAGRLADAAALQTRKAELAGGYRTATRQLAAGAARLSPQARTALAGMRDRHERLRARLQTNMTVVATAHAVAEGLIRGAGAEAARRNAPQTYSAGGRHSGPPAQGARPVVINCNF